MYLQDIEVIPKSDILGIEDSIMESWVVSRVPKVSDPIKNESNRESFRSEIDRKKVLSMSLPVSDTISVTMELTIPIILREVLTSYNQHDCWLQSTRILDLRDFPVYSKASEAIDFFEDSQNKIIEAIEKGESQDSYRNSLTLLAMSTGTYSFSFRTWLLIVNYLKSKVSDSNYAHVASRDLACKLTEVLSHGVYSIDIGDMLKGYPTFSPMDELPEDPSPVGVKHGGFTSTGKLPMTFAGYAQAVRHRQILVRSSFESDIFDNPSNYGLDQSASLYIDYCASDIMWKVALSKRSCWLLSAEIWQPIISRLGLDLPLPCEPSGKCIYHEDANLRWREKTLPPCPHYEISVESLQNNRQIGMTAEEIRDSRLSYADKFGLHKDWYSRIDGAYKKDRD